LAAAAAALIVELNGGGWMGHERGADGSMYRAHSQHAFLLSRVSI
jgi:hypothetical protein